MKHWFVIGMVAVMSLAFGDAKKTEQVKPAIGTEPVSPQYDNRFGFSFDRVVFDHNKANCIYFGADFWIPYFFSHSRNSQFGHLYEGELRLGYNFFLDGCDHFTPMAGVGYLYFNLGDFHRAKFAYTTAGLRYYHEFNTVLGWGLYLKGLAGKQFSGTEAKKFAWGVDLSMPFVFRFGKMRHWDLTLEPFYLYIESNHKHQAAFGGRGTFGYQF